MNHDSHTIDTTHGTLTSYCCGFIASLVLTLAAYFIVAEHLLPDETLVMAIIGLGITQTVVQLLFSST